MGFRSSALFGLGLVIAAVSPALAQAPAQTPAPAAQATPASTPSPFDKAVQDRLAGRFTEAIAELRTLADQAPMDADIWLNLGLAYTAKGDFQAAEAALARGLQISPNYTDIQVAYARVAFFRGKAGEARKRLEPVLAANPSDSDAPALMKQIRAAQTTSGTQAWRVDANTTYSSLTQGLQPWREYDLAAGRSFSTGTSVSAGIEQTTRFGINNTYFSATVGQRFGKAGAFISYGGSPNAVYRARNAIAAGVIIPPFMLPDGANLVGEVDVSWSRYPLGDVRTITPSMTLNVTDAFSLTAKYFNTLDSLHVTQTGFSVSANATLLSRYHVTAGYASAPNTSSGITVEDKAYNFGVGVDLGATNLHANTVYEDLGTYRRNDYSVGLTQKF